MRLTDAEIAQIKAGVAEWFGTPLPVRLFGSRTDDDRRGGDIDLIVDVPAGRATLRDEIGVQGAISRRLDERKIDVLLLEDGVASEPFERIAVRDGVLL